MHDWGSTRPHGHSAAAAFYTAPEHIHPRHCQCRAGARMPEPQPTGGTPYACMRAVYSRPPTLKPTRRPRPTQCPDCGARATRPATLLPEPCDPHPHPPHSKPPRTRARSNPALGPPAPLSPLLSCPRAGHARAPTAPHAAAMPRTPRAAPAHAMRQRAPRCCVITSFLDTLWLLFGLTATACPAPAPARAPAARPTQRTQRAARSPSPRPAPARVTHVNCLPLFSMYSTQPTETQVLGVGGAPGRARRCVQPLRAPPRRLVSKPGSKTRQGFRSASQGFRRPIACAASQLALVPAPFTPRAKGRRLACVPRQRPATACTRVHPHPLALTCAPPPSCSASARLRARLAWWRASQPREGEHLAVVRATSSLRGGGVAWCDRPLVARESTRTDHHGPTHCQHGASKYSTHSACTTQSQMSNLHHNNNQANNNSNKPTWRA